MIRKHPSSSRRSGVVLLVVITLLALFAAMGLSFVFYAEGEAMSAQYGSDAENKIKVDADPELMLSYFLQRFLTGERSYYSGGSTSPTGLYSAMRGKSLAENLYGYNYLALNPNAVPFNGVELKNFPAPALFPGQPAGLTYADLLNFTYYPPDGFIIDPERMNIRVGSYPAVMSTPLSGPYVGWNVPYTYSDMNNFYLGAMDSSGELLAPSFFRTYANTLLPMDPTQPNYANWLAKDPWWKYLTARPHPSVHPYFPLPQGGGDVRNLDFGPGLKNPSGGYYPMDSPWIDMGIGVMTGPDGRKYKVLFAPLIISLDGKINVNACGNISNTSGASQTNASNQGLTTSEISLSPFLLPAEYPNLFLGANGIVGKYGSSGVPGIPGASVTTLITSKSPPFQGPLDRNMTTVAGAQTTKMMLPGETGNTNFPYIAWPNFPTTAPGFGWGTFGDMTQANGQSATSAGELLKNPASYNTFNPPNVGNTSTNRAFQDSCIEALYRYRGTGSPALSSDLFRLIYNSLNDPTGHNRMSLTTKSFSLGMPTASPWISTNPTFPTLPGSYQLTGTASNPTGAVAYPQGRPIAFPATNNAPPGAGEFAAGAWNYTQALMKRVNLNRPLTAYPTPNTVATAVAPVGVIDPSNYGQFAQAVKDRQSLAQDIFNVLTQVTMGGLPNLPAASSGFYPVNPTIGSPPAANPAYPGYQSLIWLAQLSVNIVDFIDSDNYITPFNWNPNDLTNGWVYGTEQPRLVINEVYAEIDDTPGDPAPPGMVAKLPYQVSSWVEMHNPLPADPSIVDIVSGVQGAVRLEMPGGSGVATYPIYTLSVSNQPAATLFLNPQLGTPNVPLPVGVTSYSPAKANATLQTVAPAPANTSFYSGPEGNKNGTSGNSGFYVIGPAAPPTNPFQTKGANKVTPTLLSGMTFPVAVGQPVPNTNYFLQRLACPDLPPNPNPGTGIYNPYVTVDYFTLTAAQINDARAFAPGPQAVPPVAARSSYGRMQPFAAAMPMAQVPIPALAKEPQHTFFRHNARQATAPPANWPTVTSATWPATAGQMPPQTLAIPFNWLVHLDRQVTSPLEILHASAYPPYQLTQQFMYASAPFASSYGHTSMPAWFDDSARIYRALEFFDAGIRATAVDPYGQVIPLTGRIPGRININEIWDKKQLRALCDPQTGLSTFTQAQVDQIFTMIMNSRTPNGIPSANDHPFKGMAAGNLAVGSGIEDTFLRPGAGVVWNPAANPAQLNSPVNTRLLAIPNQTVTIGGVAQTPPSNYVQMELMNKIFNNVTCQSNVFAIWLTVGFFDVTDGPVTIATTIPSAKSITVPAVTGTQLGVPWIIQTGCGIWVDNEPMSVASVTGTGPYTITFTNKFASAHTAGAAVVGMKGVLGGEVGLSEGRNVRHRMFCMVDRSALSVPSVLTQVPGAVLNKSAVAPPAANVNLISLPQGQVGVPYNPPPVANPAGYTVFVPNGPFKALTNHAVAGTGLVANVAANSSWVTFTGTPIASASPTDYFSINFHKAAGGFSKQYFKISIPQSTQVTVNQFSGVANVNFPSQSTPPGVPPVGPSMNVNYSWKIQQGMSLVISGLDANTGSQIQETITVNNVTGKTITASFANAYAAGASFMLPGQPGAVPGSILGNPGPQQLFDHRQNTALVPHYSIIQ